MKTTESKLIEKLDLKNFKLYDDVDDLTISAEAEEAFESVLSASR